MPEKSALHSALLSSVRTIGAPSRRPGRRSPPHSLRCALYRLRGRSPKRTTLDILNAQQAPSNAPYAAFEQIGERVSSRASKAPWSWLAYFQAYLRDRSHES